MKKYVHITSGDNEKIIEMTNEQTKSLLYLAFYGFLKDDVEYEIYSDNCEFYKLDK